MIQRYENTDEDKFVEWYTTVWDIFIIEVTVRDNIKVFKFLRYTYTKLRTTSRHSLGCSVWLIRSSQRGWKTIEAQNLAIAHNR